MKAAQDGSAFFGQYIQKTVSMLSKISNAETTEGHHTRTAEKIMQYLIFQLKNVILDIDNLQGETLDSNFYE